MTELVRVEHKPQSNWTLDEIQEFVRVASEAGISGNAELVTIQSNLGRFCTSSDIWALQSRLPMQHGVGLVK